jgi:hypothetical protein
MNSTVKLTLRHVDLIEKDIRKDEGKIDGFNNGWPVILSNLKSLLETGKTLSAFLFKLLHNIAKLPQKPLLQAIFVLFEFLHDWNTHVGVGVVLETPVHNGKYNGQHI